MRFRYLLWDMDGTLFDTYPATNVAVVEAFAAAGVDVDPEEVALLLTDALVVCMEMLSARHGLDPQTMMARVQAIVSEVPLDERPPFTGVRQVCERMIAAGGQNLIFTHRDRASLDDFLAHFEMHDLFLDTVAIDQDGGYPRKPDPTGFLTVITRHYLPLKEVLVIGDRTLDIEAGIRAGVATCLFGAQPADGIKPDYVIQTYAELEPILFEEG